MTGKDAGNGNLLSALAQAGLLIGLERNRYLKLSPESLFQYLPSAYPSTSSIDNDNIRD